MPPSGTGWSLTINACTQKPRALIDCHPPHMRRIVYAHFPSWQAKVIHWKVNNLERG